MICDQELVLALVQKLKLPERSTWIPSTSLITRPHLRSPGDLLSLWPSVFYRWWLGFHTYEMIRELEGGFDYSDIF